MDMKLRRDMHLAYVADEAVMAEQIEQMWQRQVFCPG